MERNKKLLFVLTIGLLIPILATDLATARAMSDISERPFVLGKTAVDAPNAQLAAHVIGKIGLTVTNQGLFGSGYIATAFDNFLGIPAPSCQYPYPGNFDYLFTGEFWIGAVVGRDTLVSVGADGWLSQAREMWPDPVGTPGSDIERHSIKNPADVTAKSEQDYIARYTDTLTAPGYVPQDPFDNRPHIPLNIEITQRSYAWSYSYAEDFVLFDYSIKNIGRNKLSKVYMGVYVDGDVGRVGGPVADAADDICGFKRAIESPFGCGFIDTVNIAWIADNNGRTSGNEQNVCPGAMDITGVTGTRVVRTPSDSLKYSFNWWVSNGDASQDFGPRLAGTDEDPFRDFGGFLGTPEGDRNKYYIMRHEEFDYDQLFSGLDHTGEGWLPRTTNTSIPDGFDTRYLLSFGPFDISPGEVLPISFAYVAGEDFHHDCAAWTNLWNVNNPEVYYNQLSFEDLGKNALWASWIYDNPGVDTDGDGYKGKYRVCVYAADTTIVDTLEPPAPETTIVYTEADTTYYEGDGVPDFVGASPPPPPVMWLYPRVTEFNEGELVVRFNGFRSETEKDVFSNELDFEGYRIKQSLSEVATNFVLVTSYDKEDYNQYYWNNSRSRWDLSGVPFTIEALKAMYGPNFDPLVYTIDNPFYWNGVSYYFTRQDWNVSSLTDTNFIHKIYPDEPYPTTLIVDSAKIYHPEELTADGYFKYFEYEYTLRHLLASQPYYISVTAFDYGSPASGLPSLESSVSSNMIKEYPQNQNSVVESKGLNVVVYPNPYRLDAKYRRQEGGGFEGRGQKDQSDERVRRIHFTNLPNKCKIRIYTLDGDLVREINHDMVKDSPGSMHEEWDLITRNTQMIVSGIYYYSVESESGNQVGKLVIIL